MQRLACYFSKLRRSDCLVFFKDGFHPGPHWLNYKLASWECELLLCLTEPDLSATAGSIRGNGGSSLALGLGPIS
eukprot:9502357-Pyramimonas_sp.AAC.1